ncbi:hypothetical protein GGP65_003138 [Salinibacter ruber]|jgi:hypothetical protein|nr:hypothetical protein [Salinibacter ruber]
MDISKIQGRHLGCLGRQTCFAEDMRLEGHVNATSSFFSAAPARYCRAFDLGEHTSL